jgi:hypothetical protein
MTNVENVRRTRRRFKQEQPLRCRLQSAAEQCRQAAAKQPSGPKREALLRAARRYEVTAHLDEWLSSPEMQPPKPSS